MSFRLTEKQRTWLRGAADIIVDCLPEETPIEGNALASGDGGEDQRAEQSLRDQLEAGNEWAWCCIKVTLRWNEFEGTDYLGCCSYSGMRAFKEGDYFPDMVSQAFDSLVANIEHQVSSFQELMEIENA